MNIHSKNISPPEQDRNPAEYAVLGALGKGPTHGYDIYQNLSKNLVSIWTLGLSQVYALLSRLEQEELVIHQRHEQEKRPDRKIFTLTPKGIKIFKNWVRQPVPHMRDLRLEFLCKLHFARTQGRGAETRLIEAQISLLEEKSQRMHSKAKSMEAFMEIQALQFRLSQTEAAMAWLKALSETDKQSNQRYS
ncbi:MAG: PadR family transcriptional regulator [Deltaproteobacteria bacterium]|nr:PadR family transcriptional regulator [Deltaproteobacteria bacterium]